jgi:alpha-tubulin suppressor-like RCC1 family protein
MRRLARVVLLALVVVAVGCRRADARKVGQGTFVPSVGGGGAVAIAAGDARTCVLMSDGAVRCWGFNMMGEASGSRRDGETIPRPRLVEGATGAVQLATRGAHSCVRDRAGNIACWGVNLAGALDGHPSTGDRLGVRSAPGVRGDDIAVGYLATCALSAGNGTCWGHAEYGRLSSTWERDGAIGSTGLRNLQPPRPLEGVRGARQIAIGLNHACALLEDGTVTCWGLDNAGQLGRPGAVLRPDGSAAPALVPGLDAVVQIDAYNFTTCALRVDGSVWCWGRDDGGMLGAGSRTLERMGSEHSGSSTPAPVTGLSDAILVAVGGDHVCAVTASGRAFCWGSNESGQLGDGTKERRTAATLVKGLEHVAQIAVGTASGKSSHTCALSRDGAVFCWGSNRYDALGIGRDSPDPARVPL